MPTYDISKLEALEKAATVGPWHACGEERGGCKCCMVWSTPESLVVADDYYTDDFPNVDPEEKKANALFIAYIRTHAKEIIEDLKTAVFFRGALQASMLKPLSLHEELPPPGWQPTEEDRQLLKDAPHIDLDADLGNKADEASGLARLAEAKHD